MAVKIGMKYIYFTKSRIQHGVPDSLESLTSGREASHRGRPNQFVIIKTHISFVLIQSWAASSLSSVKSLAPLFSFISSCVSGDGDL